MCYKTSLQLYKVFYPSWDYIHFVNDEVQNKTFGFQQGLGWSAWLSQKASINNLQLIES